MTKQEKWEIVINAVIPLLEEVSNIHYHPSVDAIWGELSEECDIVEVAVADFIKQLKFKAHCDIIKEKEDEL